jgi:hypothetical protein
LFAFLFAPLNLLLENNKKPQKPCQFKKNHQLSIIFGRAPHYVRVGTFRASLRSVLRTLRPYMRLTQTLTHRGKKITKKPSKL